MARQLVGFRLSRGRAEADRSTPDGLKTAAESETSRPVGRLRKFARKLGGLCAAAGASLRISRPKAGVFLAGECRRSPEVVAIEPLLRGVPVQPIKVVDANSEAPRTRDGVARIFCYPERGPRQLRRLAARQKADARSWRAASEAAAAAMSVDPRVLLAEATALGSQLAATPGSTLVTMGSLAWNAQLSLAARFANRPWIAAVDLVDPPGSESSRWSLVRLRSADLVVARSQAIAEALVNSGIDAGRVLVDYPSPIEGLFTGRSPARNTILAFGNLDSVRVWDECITGFAAAAHRDHGRQLRIVAKVDPKDPASLVAEAAVRELAARWPGQIAVKTVASERPNWRGILSGPPPAGLLWVGQKSGAIAAPHPVVLSAMAAGLPIAAWKTRESADLFGSLGAVANVDHAADVDHPVDIDHPASVDVAALLHDVTSGSEATIYRAEMLRSRLRELPAGGRHPDGGRVLELLQT